MRCPRAALLLRCCLHFIWTRACFKKVYQRGRAFRKVQADAAVKCSPTDAFNVMNVNVIYVKWRVKIIILNLINKLNL